ncbi:MAG: hypothetical protein CMJ81_05345 [Planctomycetaceae bacterium]|nr:hypothetical protein [Planctomycetaceae bacterium]
MRNIPLVVTVFCASLFAGAMRASDEPGGLTYEHDIRPIFKAYCFDCHGASEELKGELDLRLKRLLVRGGKSGPAIQPGKPAESHLIRRVLAGQMPPGENKLPPEQVAILQRWIAEGAPTARPEPDTLDAGIGITPEERAFWSFQPIKRHAVPAVTASDRVRTPIDAFLLARMQQRGLTFSPDADKRTLLLRASLDLTGLPPKPAQIESFLADTSEDAYEKLIERLLESKHYGERWARHWLDIAGYADTEGSTNSDADRPWAYFYRDYVIRSLNADKPFYQFLREQLAGSEMVPRPHKNLLPDQIEKLTATGFLRMAADGTGSGANDETARNQTIADTIKIISTSLLGLSVGCAQCHDHRFDPISQKDYYQLRAVFEPALDWKNWRTPGQRLVSLYTRQDRDRSAEIEREADKIIARKTEQQSEYITEAFEKELTKFPEELHEQLRTAYRMPEDQRNDQQKQLLAKFPSANITPGTLYQYNQQHADELKKFDERVEQLRSKKAKEQFLRVLSEVPDVVPETFVFHRGEHQQPTERVTPAALTIAAPAGRPVAIANNDPSLPTTGRRLAYAKWLTNGTHPLVTRVLVNRVWLHHFGRGLVGTPTDFGVLGERPTHPQLLDWLASEFVARDWSLKELHRLIMTSTAYRQSSVADARQLAIEPANRLYWKWPVQRLDAEIVRDRILATSGVLRDNMFGPPVLVGTDDAGQVIVEGDETRRSIYILAKRTQPVALLKAFDAPVMEVNCERRSSSTVATQSLMLMNSNFILRHAGLFALRLQNEVSTPVPVDFDLSGFQGLESDWDCGWGDWDQDGQRVTRFAPFPHWTGQAWQGGQQLPDPELGAAMLGTSGGHPGEQLAVIRRWVAPRAGQLTISGRLVHKPGEGDGVQASVHSSRGGLAGQWTAQKSSTDTNIDSIHVQPGDTIDLVVDCRQDATFDTYDWEVQLQLKTEAGELLTTTSKEGFHGPQPAVPLLPGLIMRAWQLAYGRPASEDELSGSLEFLASQVEHVRQHGPATVQNNQLVQAVTNLCQVLLTSNEFLYVD